MNREFVWFSTDEQANGMDRGFDSVEPDQIDKVLGLGDASGRTKNYGSGILCPRPVKRATESNGLNTI
jgi:hypothetical protein